MPMNAVSFEEFVREMLPRVKQNVIHEDSVFARIMAEPKKDTFPNRRFFIPPPNGAIDFLEFLPASVPMPECVSAIRIQQRAEMDAIRCMGAIEFPMRAEQSRRPRLPNPCGECPFRKDVTAKVPLRMARQKLDAVLDHDSPCHMAMVHECEGGRRFVTGGDPIIIPTADEFLAIRSAESFGQLFGLPAVFMDDLAKFPFPL